jgi:hypothetical protein
MIIKIVIIIINFVITVVFVMAEQAGCSGGVDTLEPCLACHDASIIDCYYCSDKNHSVGAGRLLRQRRVLLAPYPACHKCIIGQCQCYRSCSCYYYCYYIIIILEDYIYGSYLLSNGSDGSKAVPSSTRGTRK